MATVVHPVIEPNADAIKAHLLALFSPAMEEYPRGLIEIAHGPDQPNQASYFGFNDDALDRAVDFAIFCNRRGENVYVGANPRKPTTSLKGRASDSDVEIAFFNFADIDDADASERVRSGLPLKPSMVVLTGTMPHNRPHLYWQLEEPVGNLDAWRTSQQGIAQSLGGDLVVINPSRIMRLAGTVNYPKQHKLEKGYRMELTTLRTEFASERPPVTPALISQAYPVRVTNSVAPVVIEGQTTLSAMRGTRVADLINACRADDQWHINMVRLVGHMANVGRSDAEILGLSAFLTLPGYTVEQTMREMLAALRGARSKWNLPEPQDTVEQEEAEREDGSATFTLLDMDELEALPPPTWLIDGLVTDHGLTVAYGPPGAGKSFIVLDMALRIAYGMDWHGRTTQRVGVLYVAGEGARGLGKRIKGWRKTHFHEGEDAPFLLLPVAVQLLDVPQRAKLLRTIEAAKARAGFDIGLVVIDTVSRAIAGQDENGQEAMSNFVGACGEIQAATGGALVGVHHSGKDIERGMRGSTVLLGACDASLRITKEEQIATLTVEKQKDAEELAPILMKLEKVQIATGLSEEETTLVPVILAADEQREQVTDQRSLSRQQVRRVFDEIQAAWLKKMPWSVFPQTRKQGRYLPAWMRQEFEIDENLAVRLLSNWQMNNLLVMAEYDAHTKAKGLRVERHMED